MMDWVLFFVWYPREEALDMLEGQKPAFMVRLGPLIYRYDGASKKHAG